MAVSAPTLVGNFTEVDNLGTVDCNVNDASTTGSFTFAMVAGRRYYVTVHSYSAGAAELPTSVTFDPGGGDASSFVKVTDGTDTAEQTGAQGNTGDTFSLWYFDATVNTGTSFLRVIFGATQSAAGIGVSYVTGHNEGATGASAHPQVVLNSGTSASASATFGTAPASDSLTLFPVAINTPSSTIAADESRTELYENDEPERNNHALHYQAGGTDTTLTATLGASQAWGAFAVEVAAAAAGGQPAMRRHGVAGWQPPQPIGPSGVRIM